eukprot:scaffold110227_cov33-Tisochrysis_lutea.AAC.2
MLFAIRSHLPTLLKFHCSKLALRLRFQCRLVLGSRPLDGRQHGPLRNLGGCPIYRNPLKISFRTKPLCLLLCVPAGGRSERVHEVGEGIFVAWTVAGSEKKSGTENNGRKKRLKQRERQGKGALANASCSRRAIWDNAPHVSISLQRASIRRHNGTRGAVKKKQRMSSDALSASRTSSSRAGMLATCELVCIAMTRARCKRYQSFRDN